MGVSGELSPIVAFKGGGLCSTVDVFCLMMNMNNVTIQDVKSSFDINIRCSGSYLSPEPPSTSADGSTGLVLEGLALLRSKA